MTRSPVQPAEPAPRAAARQRRTAPLHPSRRSRLQHALPLAAALCCSLHAQANSTPARELLALPNGGVIEEASSVYRDDYSAALAIDDFAGSAWCSARGDAQRLLVVALPQAASFEKLGLQLSSWTSETPTWVELLADGQPVGRLDIPRQAREGQELWLNLPKPVRAQRIGFRFGPARSGDSVCVAELRGMGQAEPLPTASFSGSWYTGWQFGTLQLHQQGSRLQGCYDKIGGVVQGTVEGPVAQLRWQQDNGEGAAALRSLGAEKLAGVTRDKFERGWSGGAAFTAERRGEPRPCPHLAGPAKAAESPLARELDEKGQTVAYGLHFDTGSAQLRPEAQPVLDEAAAVLKARPQWRVAIEGHTDSVGGAAYNQALSQRRAQAVVAALAQRGVAAERLQAQGYGDTRPLADNASSLGRAQNRRVAITRLGAQQ